MDCSLIRQAISIYEFEIQSQEIKKITPIYRLKIKEKWFGEN